MDYHYYKNTFISYYFPYMKKEAGAWATTHFNPYLKVDIIGLTAEQENELINMPYKPSNYIIIGSWIVDLGQSRYTIYKKNNKFYNEIMFLSGFSISDQILKNSISKGIRFDFYDKELQESNAGLYFFINKTENLELINDYGLSETAIKIDEKCKYLNK